MWRGFSSFMLGLDGYDAALIDRKGEYPKKAYISSLLKAFDVSGIYLQRALLRMDAMTIRPTFEIPQSYFEKTNAMRLLDWLESAEDGKLRRAFNHIYHAYEDRWEVAAGSSHNHQAWPGGLRDHLASMCRDGWDCYQFFSRRYSPLPYTFDDILVGIFCHDAEKLIKGSAVDDRRFKRFHLLRAGGMEWEDIKWELLEDWEDLGLVLTEKQKHALKYTHGEPDHEYRKDMRVMWELDSYIHCLDNGSARGRHDKGRGQG